MADDLSFVEPGQLITADLLNKIITRVLGMGTPADGKVEVPNVFGRTLSDAVQLLATPGANVQLGSVLDVSGGTIAPSDPTKAGLRVLVQQPSPGTRVLAGSGVNLVIAGSTVVPVPATPKIDGFAPVPQAVGQVLQIIGQNFDPNRANNQVTINGKSAGVPAPNSTSSSLFVVVPPGAEGSSVPVRVTLPDSRFATRDTTITPSTGAVLPVITAITTSTSGVVTSGTAATLANVDVTFTGNNFGTVPAQVRVILGVPGSAGVPTLTPTATTNTSLTVRIPASVPDAFRTSNPVISVGSVFGPASPIALFIAVN